MTRYNARRLAAVGVLAVGILLAIGLAQLGREPVAPEFGPVEERLIYPAGTATPPGFAPGIVFVRNLYGGMTVTPAPGQAGTHIDLYWDDVQPSTGDTPDWSAAQTRVAYAASLGLKSWLSLQYFENDQAAGSDGNTIDDLYLPSGVATVTYSSGTGGTCISNEVAPDYGAASYINAYATVVASMMSTFESDDNVAGYAIQIGAGGEAQNVMSETSCSTKKAQFELQVPCSEFLAAVVNGAGYYRAGTAKALTLASNLAACAEVSYNAGRKAAKYFESMLNLTPSPPKYVGYRNNGLAPDYPDAHWATPTPGPWGKSQMGLAFDELGGVAFEPGLFPSSYPTADQQGHADAMLLNAAAHRADVVFLQDDWYGLISSNVLDVITQTLGTTAADSPLAWVWFRESEYRTNVDGAGYSYSGAPGPFTHLAEVVGVATPTTYCSTNVRAASIALGGSSPPDACSQELSAPAAPESRNALGYQSGARVGIDIDDDWQYSGNVNRTYDVSLRYLDSTGTIMVVWEDTGGTDAARLITKTNTGAWVTAAFTITAALKNGLTSGSDIELQFADAQTILSSLVLEYDSVVSTPTPTPSPTITPTPSITPTPGPTSTVAPSPTAAWTVQHCRKVRPTIDGDLTEWGAMTPVALSTAAYGYKTGSPASSGSFVCAWEETYLYVAGEVTDADVNEPAGSLANGDAVRVTLDGYADGLAQARVDDRDLLISPAGRVRDFEVYPVGVTVAVSTTVGGWQFEAAVPASLLGGDLVTGDGVGITWGLVDDDDGTGVWTGILAAAKRLGVLLAP